MSTLPTDNFDAIIDIIDETVTPNKIVLTQDSGVDETVYFIAPTSGSYAVRVRPYSTMAPVGSVGVPTMGPYTVQVNQTTGQTARITQDFNLLFFDTTGNFILAVATNNVASNRPYELFVPAFSANYSQVQLVISRANMSPLQPTRRTVSSTFSSATASAASGRRSIIII